MEFSSFDEIIADIESKKQAALGDLGRVNADDIAAISQLEALQRNYRSLMGVDSVEIQQRLDARIAESQGTASRVDAINREFEQYSLRVRELDAQAEQSSAEYEGARKRIASLRDSFSSLTGKPSGHIDALEQEILGAFEKKQAELLDEAISYWQSVFSEETVTFSPVVADEEQAHEPSAAEPIVAEPAPEPSEAVSEPDVAQALMALGLPAEVRERTVITTVEKALKDDPSLLAAVEESEKMILSKVRAGYNLRALTTDELMQLSRDLEKFYGMDPLAQAKELDIYFYAFMPNYSELSDSDKRRLKYARERDLDDVRNVQRRNVENLAGIALSQFGRRFKQNDAFHGHFADADRPDEGGLAETLFVEHWLLQNVEPSRNRVYSPRLAEIMGQMVEFHAGVEAVLAAETIKELKLEYPAKVIRDMYDQYTRLAGKSDERIGYLTPKQRRFAFDLIRQYRTAVMSLPEDIQRQIIDNQGRKRLPGPRKADPGITLYSTLVATLHAEEIYDDFRSLMSRALHDVELYQQREPSIDDFRQFLSGVVIDYKLDMSEPDENAVRPDPCPPLLRHCISSWWSKLSEDERKCVLGG